MDKNPRQKRQIKPKIKVVVIGDWHFRPFKDASFAERAIAKVAEMKPDLILMTGDFLFDDLPAFEKICALWEAWQNSAYLHSAWQS